MRPYTLIEISTLTLLPYFQGYGNVLRMVADENQPDSLQGYLTHEKTLPIRTLQ